jgi:hypothetical protein
MITIRRMKPDPIYMMFVVPVCLLLTSAFFSLFFDMAGFFIPIAIFFLAMCIINMISFFQTGNKNIMVVTAFFFAACILAFSVIQISRGGDRTIPAVFLGATMFFGIWSINLAFRNKLRYRGRDIMELAAQPVEGAENGFTGRPYPVAKIDVNPGQILSFEKFVRSNLMALSYIGDDKVIFVHIIPGKAPIFRSGQSIDIQDKTWVAFEFDGNVVVNIARQDFDRFIDRLSFEQLNESLGNLWIDFFELFQDGKQSMILERLNKISTFFSI